MTHVPALVIGGGISGLVCAYALRKSGIDAIVVEAADRPGGLIESERREGYLIELGPQSFSSTPQLLELCRELGILDQLIEAPARAPRFLLIGGQLRQAPLSPPAFFGSSLFSVKTKWSLVRDILARSEPPESDESLAEFTRRKFTPELLEKLVGPFVSGIYAGDPERLSLRAAFPQVYEAERAAGSVIRGMIRAAKRKPKAAARDGAGERKRQRPTLRTFREGNEFLIHALAAKLGPALRLGTSAKEIQVDGAAAAPGFSVTIARENATQQFRTDNLVLATPTDAAASLVRSLSAEAASALGAITYPSLAVVALGYPRSAIERNLDGFGFLIPRSEEIHTLGTVWNSSLFPDRTPGDHALLTSFVGGATDPDICRLSVHDIASVVHGEISGILSIKSPPVFSDVTYYRRALPQYNVGHRDRLAAIEKCCAAMPGLFLAGNYLRGPAIGACVEQALAVAEAVAKRTSRLAAGTGTFGN